MRLIPFITRVLTDIATNDNVDSIARLSRPSLVRACADNNEPVS